MRDKLIDIILAAQGYKDGGGHKGAVLGRIYIPCVFAEPPKEE